MIGLILALICFVTILVAVFAVTRRKDANCRQSCEYCLNQQAEVEHPVV